jgi:hypothetical protein
MSFTSWLPERLRLSSRNHGLAPRPASKRRARQKQMRYRCFLEELESRIAPANILMLVDADGPGTDALKAALVSAGNTVTSTTPDYAWNTTNPSLAGFQVVIHLKGATFDTPLPVVAQQALESFVRQGGGFIGGQWNGYDLYTGDQVNMPDLVLQGFGDFTDDFGVGINVTYTTVPRQRCHPVLAGIPSSFTFSADGHDAGSLVRFATQPSTVLMTATSGGPGVIVRDFGTGHVADFSFAPNYLTQNTLQDANIQKLYVNAVTWASGLAVTPTCVASLPDSLYIGDGIDNTVKQFDAATGAYEGTFVTYSYSLGPRGMIFDQNHNLLLADQRNASSNIHGDVLEYDQTGYIRGAFVPAYDEFFHPNKYAPNDPRGLCQGKDGSVFVGDLGDLGNVFRTGLPGRLIQFDANGQWIRDLTPTGPLAGPNQVQFDTTNGPRGVVIGPDGDLYVAVRSYNYLVPANALGGEVMRFDPISGAFLGDFVDSDPTKNDLNRPEGLVFGPDGNLYVTSFANLQAPNGDTDKILEFNGTTGAYLGKIDLDQVGQPRAFAQAILFGPDGKLFASMENTGEIRRYDIGPGAFTMDPYNPGTYQAFVPARASGGPIGQAWYLTFGNTDPDTLDYDPLTLDRSSLDLGTTTYGTAGTIVTYTIGGNALTGNVLITAPAGVELSIDGATWSASLTLTPSNSTLASTTIDVRIRAGVNASNVSGVIRDTSSGAKERDVSLSGTISPATLAVTANPQTKVYGSADPTLTYTASGFQFNDTAATVLSGSLTRAAGEAVAGGPYAITIGALATNTTNYTIAFTGSTLTITAATPTVQVTDAGGTYNQSPFAATATVAGVNQIAGSSLENVAPTLTYYVGSTASGTPLGGAPLLPGTYTVAALFAGSPDYTSASATTTFTIQTPTTSIAGPTIGVPGQPLTYTFAVNGPTQGIVFNVNYGDGATQKTNPDGPSIKLDHLYTATGSFAIQVTAADQNGVVSQQATQTVEISTVVMEADPSGGTALAVGGNAVGGDTIDVSATDTTGQAVNVTVNKASFGTYTPTGHIFVYGQGGKDKIKLKPYAVGNTNYYIQVPAFLYGEGSGGDHISALGSAANNVLTGQGTNEVLTGGQGRDLLIGGTGAATLNAGVQDDLLIGGWTTYDISSAGMTYDQKLAALYAIMTEWASADSYGARLNVLAGYLNSNTVHDNYQNGVAIVDELLGNAKANDWFFAGVNDYVAGTNKNDVISMIN